MATSRIKKTRNSYTLKEKMEIIALLENGKSKIEVSLDVGIPLESVKTIWKNKTTTKTESVKRNENSKKSRSSKYKDLDNVLFDWFRQQRFMSVSIPLYGTILRAKAMFFAQALGIADFTGSNGWFHGWKNRIDVRFSKINGESRQDDDVAKEWLQNKLSIDGIENANETVTIEAKVKVSSELSEDEILSAATSSEHYKYNQEEENYSTGNKVEVIMETEQSTPPPPIDIFFHLEKIRKWIRQTDHSEELHDHVWALEKFALNQSIHKPVPVQPKITDYFPVALDSLL